MERRLDIRRLRESLGMSQRDLAARLGLSPAAVAQWETGKNKPSMDNLLALAAIFDCPMDELFAPI